MVIMDMIPNFGLITEVAMDIKRVDNAYVRGGEAFVAGIPREGCPFLKDTYDRQEWLDGWDEAKQHEIDNREPAKP